MKIYLNIEAGSPQDLEDAIVGLAKSFGGVTGVSATIAEETRTVTVETAPEVVKAEAPKQRAGRKPKQEMPADPPVEAVAEPEPEVAEEEVAETLAELKEPTPLTKEEIRTEIIDLLSGWAEFVPSDPEIRRKKLNPILEKFKAEKIKDLFEVVPQDKWSKILNAVAESKAELVAARAEE